MQKSTAKAIEAEAVWRRLPHHLPLPELWQEIQREAQEQLVRVVQFLIPLHDIFRVCLWLQTRCVRRCGAMRSLAGSVLEGGSKAAMRPLPQTVQIDRTCRIQRDCLRGCWTKLRRPRSQSHALKPLKL
jgi:hypothetical protein